MLKKTIIILCLIFLRTGPALARDSKIFPYEYFVKDLDNGLRVIVIPTDYPNIVSLQIPVQTGSRNEVEPGKSGFAHFFEHMMFRGTPNYSTEEYNGILQSAGADSNAYTSDDLTNYHTTFSKEDLETVLMLEADRFQNLQYTVEDFKTESRAVLGEYNKNFANPIRRMLEAQRDAAFQKHTYKHTTMGFIQDIEDMPNQFDYSLEFFNRYYRPEYVTIIVSGDVDPNHAFTLVDKYWAGWERGTYTADIPQEPVPTEPVYRHVEWESPTLPWVSVAFHGPAFSDSKKDMIGMDLIQSYAFSQSSEIFQKLVVQEQVVDQFFPSFPDRKDPHLLTVAARVKDVQNIWYVRDEILKAFANARIEKIPADKLEAIKGNLKYSFAHSLDNSEAIADAMVGYVHKTRDPETINRVYQLYDEITSDEIEQLANRYFTDNRAVFVTLAHGPLPEVADTTPSIENLVQPPSIETVLIRNSSPVINLRILFNVGAASDPKGKEGLANLTAAMITGGGSKKMGYTEIQKARFPMAAFFFSQVDKEMTVFRGTVHSDNLSEYNRVTLPQLLEPAWDESDFKRVKANLMNGIKVNLRDNNDEELGKEVLYEMIYDGHPYGHLTLGHLHSVEALTLDDVKSFYRAHYTRANLVLGLAGKFDDDYLEEVSSYLGDLPEREKTKLSLTQPDSISGLEVEIVEKETRATAISFGFPIPLNRSHPDFPALWLVRSYFGEHRSSNSYLYKRIREVRGMNYGDYAYIEYFPSGMFQFHPDPNLGRQQQIFQVWIRPVVPENGHFAIRTAMYELKKLVEHGMTQDDFQATRNFLLKFVNILTKTQDRQLGYAMDSRYYGIGEFTGYISDALTKLTLADVNRVIRNYLQAENVKLAIITRDAEDLRRRLIENTPSPIKYDAAKPEELLAEDQLLQKYQLDFKPEKVKVRPVGEVFK